MDRICDIYVRLDDNPLIYIYNLDTFLVNLCDRFKSINSVIHHIYHLINR